MNNPKTLLSIALILGIAALSFLPSLKGGFTNWDDDRYVTENPALTQLSWRNIKTIFTSFFVTHYQPLTILSYLFDYSIFKLKPLGYHLANLILHLFNCLLVFWMVWLISGKISVVFLATLLFGIHPLQVESVAWISERKNLLYAFFFLSSLICYLYYLNKGQALKYYYLCLFLFILSLLSKSMAVTLPLALFALDYLLGRRFNKVALIEKAPYFILSLILGVIAIYGVSLKGLFHYENSSSLANMFMVVLYCVIFYLNKIFLPVKLCCLYPYEVAKDTLFFPGPFIAIIILSIAIILSARYTRKLIFGSSLFLITLLPVLGFMWIGGILVADRYVYLACLGIFYLLAEGFVWLYRRTELKIALPFLLVIIVGVLSYLTWKRCLVWRDSISLWSDTIENYPDSSIAYNSRGIALFKNKEYFKAYSDFKQAVTLESYKIRSRHNYYGNLALAANAIGKKEESMALFKKAIEISPKHSYPHYNDLGVIYGKSGNYEEAIAAYNKAIEIQPAFIQAYYNLANLYRDRGENAQLVSLYAKAIANNLDYFEAYYQIANLYSDSGKNKEAIVLYRRALEINPESAETYVNLSRCYIAIGKDREAIRAAKKAIKLNPSLAIAYNNLAVAYYYQKDYALAIKSCDKAMELGYKVEPGLYEALRLYRR